MENTKYGRRRERRWTPIRAKAQDTRANLNSWETHLVRKRWDIGLLRALSLRIMMMMIISNIYRATSGLFYYNLRYFSRVYIIFQSEIIRSTISLFYGAVHKVRHAILD